VTTRYFTDAGDRQSVADRSDDLWPGVYTGLLSQHLIAGPDALFEEPGSGRLASQWLHAVQTDYGPGGQARMHRHPEREETCYVLSGEAQVVVGDEERKMGARGAVVVPAGVEHGFAAIGGGPLSMLEVHALEYLPPPATPRATESPRSSGATGIRILHGPSRYTLAASDSKESWSGRLAELYPNEDQNALEMWILTGPDYEFGRFRLGNLATRRMQITESVHGPGKTGFLHTHDDHEQLYYVAAGRAVVAVGEEERTLGPGGVAYIPQGVVHGYRTSGDAPLRLLDIHCRPAVKGVSHTSPPAL
jgi:mannose-6-phosphate isomerase-like protein (cupin superfamily)